MNILIFSIGFFIFVTYMFFLLRMVNRSHKSQERAQNKYNYKRQIHVRKNKRLIDQLHTGNYYISAHEKKKVKDRWDS